MTPDIRATVARLRECAARHAASPRAGDSVIMDPAEVVALLDALEEAQRALDARRRWSGTQAHATMEYVRDTFGVSELTANAIVDWIERREVDALAAAREANRRLTEAQPHLEAAKDALMFREQRDAAREDVRALAEALAELHAQVKGECPSLLDEDSGGDARLALAIEDACSRPGVRAARDKA